YSGQFAARSLRKLSFNSAIQSILSENTYLFQQNFTLKDCLAHARGTFTSDGSSAFTRSSWAGQRNRTPDLRFSRTLPPPSAKPLPTSGLRLHRIFPASGRT